MWTKTQLLIYTLYVIVVIILFLKIAIGETINDSIIIVVNNSTNDTWMNDCCGWMG